VRTWLANPAGTLRGLWFLTSASAAGITATPSSIRRVRVAKPRETERGHRPAAEGPRPTLPSD